MGLFNKKPKIRFETITIDRESEVFRALENKGWILCDDPFQFDVHKSSEKLRKDAMSVAKEVKGELIVEIYDPIYVNMPWKGLRYAVWKRATPEQIRERLAKQQAKLRPNYKDTMGSYEDIARKLDQKKIHVSEDDLHALDNFVGPGSSDLKGDSGGRISEELRTANEAIQAITTFDPYEHQGEMVDDTAASTGPVFQESIELVKDVPDSEDITEKVNALDMMGSAADAPPPKTEVEETTPVGLQPSQPPANTVQKSPQTTVQPPSNVPPATTPKVTLPQPGFKAPPPPPNSMIGKRDDDES